MSANVEWIFSGVNKNTGKCLTSKQIEALVALDEFDLATDDFTWDADYKEFGEGHTESSFAVERIQEAAQEFSKLYPEIRLVILYKYDTAWNPDGFVTEGGEIREFTGCVRYTFDDNGEEVKM